MRLVSALLFVALTGSAVVADDAKPADPKPEASKKKVPYRVVKMLPETGQVLLYDKHHGVHVVAEVGQGLDGYLVDDIDDEEVTLISDSGAVVVLTAPPPLHVPKRVKAKPVDPYADASPADGAPAEAGADSDAAAEAPARTAAASPHPDRPGTGGPVDPYAEPTAPATPGDGGVRVATAPSAPVGAETPVRSASAARDPHTLGPIAGAPIVEVGGPDDTSTPADPYGDPGIAAFAAAVGAEPAPPPPATATTKGSRPKVKAKSGKAVSPAPAPDAASALAAAATGDEVPGPAAGAVRPAAAIPPGSKVIARGELDAALADFSRTASTFHATFTPDGLRLDSITDGSLLAKAGLHKGDIVTYVDGRPLRTLDDAAGLYARAGAMRATTIQVARNGKLVTLHVAIQ